MSTDSTGAPLATVGRFARNLTMRQLLFARSVFVIAWVALLLADNRHLGPFDVTLLVLFPLSDVAVAVFGARSPASTGTASGWRVIIAITVVAAVGLAVASTSGVSAVLRVWGFWAIAVGAVQLIGGLGRDKRKTGGQWTMVLSGAISVQFGVQFILGAFASDSILISGGGSAILGWIFFLFFLLSALRHGRVNQAD
ncbi:uncharacterized membrane protein HdeD (DUF308 family) [Streptomyces sp. SAI-135]|uniref:hypothetical protein n=1 Tax=unclassified Streptomyces TaxID=2593676 RepID=UPI002476E6C1|nr:MULTISPECIES: hypothetical protein [unclassified Streptomyces]MDH6523017.1 uncharacterized membrane protein HdeD (DUF308 family) [Streptomyces sp. SAI-090]MDH6554634.1 uncharacterized membrane protein HdeD (DUF308 family) [Streptomyces sp. SAI-041]MDH6573900.1 uncharacterized membrane protein HdeD (DUF308 family) [Streptomyces sp. SAI-117]MDH6581364.1 uncharacterized membrane protein HdeD (DUF308 family) [Streptomyces sp. SAI-133]MDH6613370.1 uncharacterized membrane protein HdeD (DUF308 fa